MTPNEMENILYILTNLEISFCNLSNHSNYNDYQTYKKFLQHPYIRNNNLEGIYWPRFDSSVQSHRFLTNYSVITEDEMFALQRVVMMKQINLPFSHMLSNDFYQCIYVMQGEATVTMETSSKVLSRGDFFILSPGVEHLLNSSEDSIVVNILLSSKYLLSSRFRFLENFLPPDGQKSPHRFRDTAYLLFHAKDNENVKTVVLQMFSEYMEHSTYKNQVMDGYLTLLFAFLMRHQLETASDINAGQKAYQKIMQYCRNDAAGATLQDAAESLHYSKQYICKIVKEYSGKTFHETITDMKLDMAAHYLTKTTLTLEEIAGITGFSDASHLSRTFKKVRGMSPSEFRG